MEYEWPTIESTPTKTGHYAAHPQRVKRMKRKRTLDWGRTVALAAIGISLLVVSVALSGLLAPETTTTGDFYMELEGNEVYVLKMEYIPHRSFQGGEELASP